MTRHGRARRDSRGATIVEFALVASLVFMLLITAIDFGLIIIGNSTGTNAAREGARVGIINYVDADEVGSPNNAKILSAVNAKIAGLLAASLSGDCSSSPHSCVKVMCFKPSTPPTPIGDCTAEDVVVDTDLIGVTVTWQHRPQSPFVPANTHTETAYMTIGGAPNLGTTPTSVAPTTTTTTPTTTSTTIPPTTSTTTTTTTTPGCAVTSASVSPTSIGENGQSGNLSGSFTITVNTNGAAGCSGLVVHLNTGNGTPSYLMPGGPGVFTYTEPGHQDSWNHGTHNITFSVAAGSIGPTIVITVT
jgi:Flp pilus assembly pilin Flp